MKLCIVGTGRSGTTLLWRLFNAHPQLFVFKETHWLPAFLDHFQNTENTPEGYLEFIGEARFVAGTRILEENLKRHGLKLQDIKAKIDHNTKGKQKIPPTTFLNMLGSSFASAAQKEFWADKTPSYGFHMRTVSRIWPECKFIHIVRNGVAAAQSMAAHQGFQVLADAGEFDYTKLAFNDSPSPGQNHTEHVFLEMWAKMLSEIKAESEGLARNQYIELRYEDLLAAPSQVLERLNAFLQLPSPASWLADAEKEIRHNHRNAAYNASALATQAPAALTLLESYGYKQDGATTPVPPTAPDALAVATTARAAISNAVDRDLLADSTIVRVDDQPINEIGEGEVALFCAGRNEGDRLNFFLDHYRKIGVTRFFYVDNNSTDDTLAILKKQSDVHVFFTEQSYLEAHRARLWTTALRNKYGVGKWCLTVDVDELLVFPLIEYFSVTQLTDYMGENNFDALFTIMLDMYPRSFNDSDYERGDDFNKNCPYFDTGPYWLSHNKKFPFLSIYGGIRHRLFFKKDAGPGPILRNGAPVLRKVPLVRWNLNMNYYNSTHSLTPCALAPVTGALLHYKFLGNFEDFAREEMQRGERPPGEYEVYENAFASHSASNLLCENSVQYESPQQLIELGLLRAPKSYINMAYTKLKTTLDKKTADKIRLDALKSSATGQQNFQPELGHGLHHWELFTHDSFSRR